MMETAIHLDHTHAGDGFCIIGKFSVGEYVGTIASAVDIVNVDGDLTAIAKYISVAYLRQYAPPEHVCGDLVRWITQSVGGYAVVVAGCMGEDKWPKATRVEMESSQVARDFYESHGYYPCEGSCDNLHN